MTKFTFVTFASLSLALAGCQKAKMSTANSAAPATTNFAPSPVAPQPQVPPGAGPMPIDTTSRTPSPEPLDPPPVVIPPPPANPPPVYMPPPRIPTPEPVSPTPPIYPPPSNPPPTTWTPSNPPVQQPPLIPPPVQQPPSVQQPPLAPPPVQQPPVLTTPAAPTMPVSSTQTVLQQFPNGGPPRPAEIAAGGGARALVAKVAPIATAITPVVSAKPAPIATPVTPVTTASVPLPPPRPAVLDQPPIPSVTGTCDIRPVTVPNETKQLDILFVVDTSASLVKGPQGSRAGGELPAIARQMQNFVDQLDASTDIRIGVLLGHGPTSVHFGKLFTLGGNDPAVLDLNRITPQAAWQNLERKMLNVPNDESDAQGEALMLNIYEALGKKANRDLLVKQGLLRPNTKLAIIGVSDEQDVCWNYPGTPYRAGGPAQEVDEKAFAEGRVPVLKPIRSRKKGGKAGLSPDVHEMRFFADVCANFVQGTANANHTKYSGGSLVTPAVIEDTLESLKNPPYNIRALVNMIAYPDNTGLKASTGDEDENEMAHGLLNVITDLNSGGVANLKDVRNQSNKVDFTRQLSLLGENVYLNMKMDSKFECYGSPINPLAINLTQVSVDVTDASNGHPLAHYTSGPDGGLTAHRDEKIRNKTTYQYLTVTPKDQMPFMKSLEEKHVKKVNYEIHFKTLENYDTKTGKPVSVRMPEPSPVTPAAAAASNSWHGPH